MISGLITYALTCGGDDAELHDKEVTLTTSDVTGSQTAIFEYDPQDEPPSGRPPGPWDGYSLFTIDLSGVKDDIEDLQQQVSDLEDALEEMQECCEDVAEILDATPEEGESCCDAVKRKAQDAVDKIEECDDCKDAVIAAIQQYVPSFTPDPTTCNIPDGVDDVYQKGKDDEKEEDPPWFEFDPDVTLPDISKIVASDPVGSANSDYYLKVYVHAYQWGVTPPQVYEGRTVYATSETGEISAQMCADIVDGSGTVIRHYITAQGYSVFPQLNGYAQISDYSITNDTITINMFIYRNDGWSSTQTTTFPDLLFADFATGPYIVKNK